MFVAFLGYPSYPLKMKYFEVMKCWEYKKAETVSFRFWNCWFEGWVDGEILNLFQN